MEIKKMFKLSKPDSKIKAFFTIETKTFTINDCKLVEGSKGLFVAFPSREYLNKKGEKQYQAIIWIKDTDVVQKINDEAIRIYGGEAPRESEEIPF